jgi:K+-transporting ATPase ATPase A chain
MLGDVLFMVLLVAVLLPLAWWIGAYMARVFNGERVFLTPIVLPVERFIYRLCRVDPAEDTGWKKYALALILFNLAGFVFLYLVLVLQGVLPWNPRKFAGVRWDTALNIAVSFMTNTNWQSYGGESTLSYFSQMVGLTVQNFVSAATGFAAAVALIRGFTRKTAQTIGNFWVDLTRSVLYILLPLAILMTLLLVSQGVVQTFSDYVHVKTLSGAQQTIAVGPAASQIAIKQLGSNGGGFFNANSAHPFENPNWFSNFLELIGILLLPASFPFMLGKLLGSKRKGVAIFLAMSILFTACLGFSAFYEAKGNPVLAKIGVSRGVNMEGKETRYGVFQSVLWAVATTSTSNGSVNSMHDSFTPIPGLFLLFNIAIGEVVYGGVGVGLISMLFYAFMTMFLAGLMIGRTPEIYNKKLEPFEMVMTVIGLLAPAFAILIFTAIAVMTKAGLSSLNNAGPHGFTEIFYAFCSAAGNNGSAFAGLNANTPFYNLTQAFEMALTRFTTILPAIAIGGALAAKKIIPDNPSMFRTTRPVFIFMLTAMVIIFGGLNFFIPFVLGPVLDHLSMIAGHLF